MLRDEDDGKVFPKILLHSLALVLSFTLAGTFLEVIHRLSLVRALSLQVLELMLIVLVLEVELDHVCAKDLRRCRGVGCVGELG